MPSAQKTLAASTFPLFKQKTPTQRNRPSGEETAAAVSHSLKNLCKFSAQNFETKLPPWPSKMARTENRESSGEA